MAEGKEDVAARFLGDAERANRYYAECLSTFRRYDLAKSEADTYASLGAIACDAGQYEQALDRYEQARAVLRTGYSVLSTQYEGR